MIETLKQPHNSLESEQSLLGAILIGADFSEVANLVTAEDFYYQQHQIIFNSISFMFGSGLKVDFLTLSAYMEAKMELEVIGGLAYLADLAKNTPSQSYSTAYAAIVKDRAILRSITRAGMAISQIPYSELTTDEKVSQAQGELMKIGETKKDADIHELSPILLGIVDDIQQRSDGKKNAGLSTGYGLYDWILKGLRGGHTHVIAGRPGSGKTTFAMNIAENIASGNNPVLVFSLEMPRRELVIRMIASLGRISADSIDDGDMEGKWDGLSLAVTKLKSMPLSICDTSGMTIQRIRTIARYHKKAKGTKLIILDYIGLVRTPNAKQSNRNNELGEVSRQLKEMAKELDLPVILLAQLNRGIENRSEKTPSLADLRDSGEIEQDADTVTFLYREKEEQNGLTKVTVAKNRHGKTGNFELVLKGDQYRFNQLSDSFVPQQAAKKDWRD